MSIQRALLHELRELMQELGAVDEDYLNRLEACLFPGGSLSILGPTVDQTATGDLKRCLRDMIATIELHTDVTDNRVDRSVLEMYIERAEDLLGERLEEIIK